jgi:hypothetical protein
MSSPPINDKDPEHVAFAIFSQWISNFGFPAKFSSHYSDDYLHAVKKALVNYIDDHPVVFGQTDQLQKPDPLYNAVTKIVQETDLSWTDYIPAMQFAYNTSYNSKLKDIPFKLLFGRNPNPLKVTEKLAADDFVHLKKNIYLETKKLFEYKSQQDKNSMPNTNNFRVDQEVFFWEKSFGMTS